MSIKSELSRRHQKAKNGEGRQTKSHLIPVPEEVFEEIGLCITAYNAFYHTRVTYEGLFRRWINHFGRIDPEVYNLFQMFKGNTVNSALAPAIEEPSDVNNLQQDDEGDTPSMPTNFSSYEQLEQETWEKEEEAEKANEEMRHKEEKEEENRLKECYRLDDQTRAALDIWRGRQGEFVTSELLKMAQDNSIVNSSGEKLYYTNNEQDCHFLVFRNRASKLAYTDHHGKTHLAAKDGVFFWKK